MKVSINSGEAAAEAAAAPAVSQVSAAQAPAQAGKKLNLKIALIALIVVVLVVLTAWFYVKYAQAQKKITKLSNPTEASKIESEALVSKVGKVIELPSGNPTVATVVDASKLSGQAFFAKSHNGDKVLIYTDAKKAILYRPSTNKVIEVAPISLGQNQSQSQSQTQPATDTTKKN
jgi:hypothetical protein